MKSYFLSHIEKRDEAESVLTRLLPGPAHPWLLLSADGDAMAYFNLEDDNTVQADVSGRHFGEDEAVFRILQRLQEEIGGQISDDA